MFVKIDNLFTESGLNAYTGNGALILDTEDFVVDEVEYVTYIQAVKDDKIFGHAYRLNYGMFTDTVVYWNKYIDYNKFQCYYDIDSRKLFICFKGRLYSATVYDFTGIIGLGSSNTNIYLGNVDHKIILSDDFGVTTNGSSIEYLGKVSKEQFRRKVLFN